MLYIISPAKTLDESASYPKGVTPTQPRLLNQSRKLVQLMQDKSAADIKTLMGVSDKIAALNAERYEHFPKTLSTQNATPAIYLFKGDVYAGLEASTLPDNKLTLLNDRVRILSGLYGLLRPFDLTYPYRLEMGLKLAVNDHKNLYAFWSDQLAKQLNDDADATGTDTLINLASNEYAKAVDKKALKLREVVVQFKEKKGNQLKVIGLMAKRARGMMTRFMIEQNPQKPDDLRAFNTGGYQFEKELSSENELIFVRG